MLLTELLDPNIKVILIKGKPGAGKTTLALELITSYGRGVYISTRVSEARLIHQFPHMRRMVEEGRLHGYALETGILFHDHRMASADNIIEAVSSTAMGIKSPMIILDSWDAIAKELSESERLKAERSIVAMAEAGDAKIIFISEEPELTTTDYMADAIVVLHDEEVEGRRYRRLELLKIRGMPIPSKYLPFTLIGARFKVLAYDLLKPEHELERAIREILDGGKEPKLTTGIAQLDDLLIRIISPGSMLPLELGPTVQLSQMLRVFAHWTISILALEGCIVMLPPMASSPYMLKLRSLLEGREELSRFKIGCMKEEQGCFKVDPTYPGITFRRIIETAKAMKNRTAGPCGIHVSMDFLESLYEPSSVLRHLTLLVAEAHGIPSYLLVDLRSSSKLVDHVEGMSPIYLRVVERDGGLFLYRVKPFSQLYAFSTGDDGSVELIPVM